MGFTQSKLPSQKQPKNKYLKQYPNDKDTLKDPKCSVPTQFLKDVYGLMYFFGPERLFNCLISKEINVNHISTINLENRKDCLINALLDIGNTSYTLNYQKKMTLRCLEIIIKSCNTNILNFRSEFHKQKPIVNLFRNIQSQSQASHIDGAGWTDEEAKVIMSWFFERDDLIIDEEDKIKIKNFLELNKELYDYFTIKEKGRFNFIKEKINQDTTTNVLSFLDGKYRKKHSKRKSSKKQLKQTPNRKKSIKRKRK